LRGKHLRPFRDDRTGHPGRDDRTRYEAAWTPASLAVHTQAVLQGASILAKATGDGQVARDSIDHLARYIELLFQPNGSATRAHHDATEHPR
jgi:hypothetical protein